MQWANLKDGTVGHGVYTSSWAAPKADVHSQQRFFYMGTKVRCGRKQRLKKNTVTVSLGLVLLLY